VVVVALLFLPLLAVPEPAAVAADLLFKLEEQEA
jgi:hypothetical protein